MKDFFNKLTSELLSSKETEFICKDSKINWVFKNVWNFNVVLLHQDVELIKFGRHLSLFFENDYFILREYGKELIKSGKIFFSDGQKISINFSLVEGIMRIIGTGLSDGTWKGIVPRTKAVAFVSFSNDRAKPYIDFLGEQGRFFQISDSLKNISGLKLWLKSDNPCELHPETNKIKIWKDNSGNSNHLIQENLELSPELDSEAGAITFEAGTMMETSNLDLNFEKNSDLTMMIVFETAEFVFQEKEQKVLSITNFYNDSIELVLEKEEDQIGRYPEYQDVTRIFLKHIFNVDGKTFENKNFIDLFTSYKFLDRYIKNERPGPEVFSLIYQSTKDNKIFMKDFNYHKDKWFSLIETIQQFDFKKTSKNTAKLILNPDGKFSGKIKEVFIFDRMFFNQEENNNENWILLYLKQKYKLNDVKFILNKK